MGRSFGVTQKPWVQLQQGGRAETMRRIAAEKFDPQDTRYRALNAQVSRKLEKAKVTQVPIIKQMFQAQVANLTAQAKARLEDRYRQNQSLGVGARQTYSRGRRIV